MNQLIVSLYNDVNHMILYKLHASRNTCIYQNEPITNASRPPPRHAWSQPAAATPPLLQLNLSRGCQLNHPTYPKEKCTSTRQAERWTSVSPCSHPPPPSGQRTMSPDLHSSTSQHNPEQFLSLKPPSQHIPQKLHTLSRKVDECKPLPSGQRTRSPALSAALPTACAAIPGGASSSIKCPYSLVSC